MKIVNESFPVVLTFSSKLLRIKVSDLLLRKLSAATSAGEVSTVQFIRLQANKSKIHRHQSESVRSDI